MSMEIIVAILVIAALAVLAAVVFFNQRRRSEHLRGRFGNEYDRAVSDAGSRHDAERELAEREERIEKLHLKEVPPDRRLDFAEEWHGVQSRFVDNPTYAIDEAQRLVEELMDARGYPVTSYERMAADVSADHPDVVADYRAAIAIANEEGTASTEDLRQAMIHYRALFAELLGATPVS